MEVLATRDPWFVTQCEAALMAEGVPLRWLVPWQVAPEGMVYLDVPASEVERASVILSAISLEERERRAQVRPPERWVPLLLQPAFAVALCMSLSLLLFFAVTGGSADQSELFTRGAMATKRFLAGDWWRIVTAATLHADGDHVLGNAMFMLVLGWAAAERVGSGVAVFAFVVTAVGGFVASLWWGKAALTVGASGGLFGLLGVSGGHAVRLIGEVEFAWRARLRAFGAAFALLAYTAFSPESNIAAHVGGFVVGLFVGVTFPRRPLSGVWQLAFVAVSLAALVVSWRAALGG